MTRDELDPERDDELHRLLERWSAPVVPDGMDERVLAAYRRQTGSREPWWTRLFTASVRVPVPVAVGVLMLLIVTAMLALRPPVAPPTAGTAGPSEPVQAARHADVPVVSRTNLAGFQPVDQVTATVVTDRAESRP
jgi:membrane-associated protease RseP (regulator of RpoE activity)